MRRRGSAIARCSCARTNLSLLINDDGQRVSHWNVRQRDFAFDSTPNAPPLRERLWYARPLKFVCRRFFVRRARRCSRRNESARGQSADVRAESEARHFPLHVGRPIARGLVRPKTKAAGVEREAVAVRETKIGANEDRKPSRLALGISKAWRVWDRGK